MGFISVDAAKRGVTYTAERAVKTFVQSAGATMAAEQTGLIHAHWSIVFTVAGYAALASVLTSLAALTGNAQAPAPAPAPVEPATPPVA